jgi:hypothetical protein
LIDKKKKRLDEFKKKVDDGRQWNLKPKKQIEDELKIKENTEKTFKKAVFEDKHKVTIDYNSFIETQKLAFDYVMSLCYALSYGIKDTLFFSDGSQVVDQEHAELIYFKSQAIGVEPYSIIKDVKDELPEYYNPKRHDFNLMIVSVGKEKEMCMQQEAIDNAKKDAMRKRGTHGR